MLAIPVMNGCEFLQHVRNSDALHKNRVVVSSASVSQKDQQTAIDSSGDDFLAKPLNAHDLFTALANQLKLKWIYTTKDKADATAQQSSDTVTLPSRKMLIALLQSAQMGHIQPISTQLTELTTGDPRYIPFASSILELSHEFKVEEIEALIQKYLAEGSACE